MLAQALGGAAALAWPRRALADSSYYELRDIAVPGDRKLGRRFTLLVPKHLRWNERVPLLVLLHGLGETHDERMGAYAWVERYGLGGAYDRLCQPPVVPLEKLGRHWTQEELDAVNAKLRAQPFRGLAIACPFTPNVYKLGQGALAGYADWLTSEVIPRARREAPVYTDAARTALDGCSLGGYVGIEVFLRKPEQFGAWGMLQGAIGKFRVTDYAKRLKDVVDRLGKRHIHLETSTGDAFREVNEQLSRALTKVGVDHELIVPRGPHNQPFLRDSGTLRMLHWYDRLPR